MRAAAMVGIMGWVGIGITGCAARLGPDTEGEGRTEDAVVAELPACASPLMRSVYQAAKEVATRGPVHEELFATAANRINHDVLIDGPEIFPKMSDLIANATREVLFQTYVWEGESVGAKNILDGLGRLQARLSGDVAARSVATLPIRVRFVIDASEFGVPSAKVSDIMPALARGIEEQHLDPALIDWQIAAFEHVTVGNQHAKTVVVDGREAVVTGANPEIVHDPGAPWHDSGYHVSGAVARALVTDFDYSWNRSTHWTCGSRRGEDCEHKTPDIQRSPSELSPALSVEDAAALNLPADTCTPVLAIGRKRNANPFNNRTDNSQDQAYLAAFRSARHKIRIETPNLNDDHAKKAILGAIERGVVVELIVGKQFNERGESAPGQGGGNEKNIAELYEKLAERNVGDPCTKLDARFFSYDGVEPIVGNGARASHTKYASIDGQIAIVGSTNMDTQSWNNAHEVNLVIDSASATRAWDEQLFEHDFNRAIIVDQCR